MIKVTIAGKSYNVQEARTEEELSKGLKGVEELPKDEGMLFYMDDQLPQQVFTMKGVKIPLDIIFINQDYEVLDAKTNCKPGQKFVVSTTENNDKDDYIAYVLEVNANSGISEGDELEIEGSEDEPVMKVLFPDGSEQYKLWGGERIFSRSNTKVLIKKAKKAQETQEDKDFKALGRYMFKCIKIQDERPAEYVDSPS